MPEIGEIKQAKEINKRSKNNRKYIWQACEGCGKGRWVAFEKGNLRCRSCSKKGIRNPKWIGGRAKTSDAYVRIRLYPNDFFYPMVNKNGYVKEHRLVMAKHLGRNLHSWEMVHHINGDKLDNRIENLQLVQEMQHKQITRLESRIAFLEQRLTLLEAETTILSEAGACNAPK